jgi:uncharacterized OB-fold protein
VSFTSAPRYWREIKYRYRLIGSRCPICGKIFFPHRTICRACGYRKLEDYKLSEKGKVLTFTVIRSPPKGYERNAPYVVGIVELNEGVKVISQIVDCDPEELQIGTPVELVFRKVKEGGKEGIIEYGYKFKPSFGK